MNAISLLKADHRKVERLFERYATAPEPRKRALLGKLTQELSVHMVAEEKVLYPVLRTGIENGSSLVDEGVGEHDQAKGLLAELREREPGTFDADAKVATLRRAIDHHVKEEENEIFPRMAKAWPKKRLNELGAALEKSKRSAPSRPAPAAAAKSPGTSVAGMAEAAANRVTNLFQGMNETRRPAARAGTSRKRRVPGAKRGRR